MLTFISLYQLNNYFFFGFFSNSGIYGEEVIDIIEAINIAAKKSMKVNPHVLLPSCL